MTNDKKIQSEFERAHPCPSRRTLTTWEGFQEGWQAALATRGDVNQELVDALGMAKSELYSIHSHYGDIHHTREMSCGFRLAEQALAKHKAGESAGFSEEELVVIVQNSMDRFIAKSLSKGASEVAITALKDAGALKIKEK